ncbi:MAG TPA: hypothetical protein VEB60_02025 [Candidatus Paceibacterota bacterium]|nr:hypothetical protein [Candidatus Paceibacterota bacterium]
MTIAKSSFIALLMFALFAAGSAAQAQVGTSDSDTGAALTQSTANNETNGNGGLLDTTTGTNDQSTMDQSTVGTTTGTATPLLPETGVGGGASLYLTIIAAALAMVAGGIVALRSRAV